MEYKINDQIFNAALNYLSTRPINEVYNLFQALAKIKKEQDEIESIRKEMANKKEG